ncbi:hypothetical protein THIAE_05955 [Thiomicrospira aerophila AL3]|uniref:Uncharacterized protein n=1 Tax=Thiomicrospira aerophila AL3 TaxID=717772 RepID=W0DZJ7_9GAMM|nr:ParB family protein [Thiomicrospira aerophila]AHF02271.1 hypothetical protein THIAE_05955 [Thiomicrospira aerophila AL3]
MSKKKQFTGLTEGQVRLNGGLDLAPQDPISRTPMIVNVFDVMTYQHNPRKHTNESYQEIKNSILKKGLEQPFLITRRPGDPKYTVKAGGNTRLQILQELYNETKDNRFLKTQLIFDPWVSETDTLISHLTENDMRGNLMLIDRAKAVAEAKSLIEKEVKVDLSARELSNALSERGYAINHSHATLLLYAVRIEAYLPEALEAGAGKAIISKIRKIENDFKKVCTKLDLEVSETETEAWFFEALKAIDGEMINLDHLRSELKDKLHHETGTSFSILDMYFYEAEGGFKASEDFDDSQDEDTSPSTPSITPQSKEQDDPKPSDDDHYSEEDMGSHDKIDFDLTDGEDLDTQDGHIETNQPQASKSDTPDTDSQPRFTVAELRDHVLDQAITLLAEHGLDDLISPVNDGFGWILMDTPDLEIMPDSEAFHQAWAAWLTAFQLSGMTDRNYRSEVLSHLESETDLDHLLNENFDQLSESAQWISMAAINTNFWSGQIDTTAHKSAKAIIELHGRIYRTLQIASKPIWQGMEG